MSVRKYLQSKPLTDLVIYHSTINYHDISIQFTGAPRKHPYDHEKIILIEAPFSACSVFYEFRIADITFMEDLPNLGTVEGETVRMANLWIRKGCLGMRFQAFKVAAPDTHDTCRE